MSRLRLTVLNNIIPKLHMLTPKPITEPLDAHIRNWFTDGYRTGAPGTSTCREDTDCEPDEICQGGFCAGLHRKHNVHGLFYGDEYDDMVGKQYNPLSYLQHGEYYRPHDFFYDYTYGGHSGTIRVHQPESNREIEEKQERDGSEYDHNHM